MTSLFARPKRKHETLAAKVSALSIRNLTGIVFELALVECFKVSSPESSGLGGIFDIGRNLSNIIAYNNTATPVNPRITVDAQAYLRRDVSVIIKPYTVTHADVQCPLIATDEVLRLTFRVDGEEYCMDCPSPQHLSQTLRPLSQSPRYTFTGVYLPAENFICLLNSASLDRWMQHLPNAAPLSALSIPGTHNSATCFSALPSVRCQAVSPTEQLANGVRFLDVRVQPETSGASDRLVLVHGAFPIALTGTRYFRELETSVAQFLERNPSETVIVSLKREGVGSATDADLARSLVQHYTHGGPHARSWHTAPGVPSLGAVRGKMVLLRRFNVGDAQRALHDGRGYGIDAASWADNTSHDVHGSVCVQDFYEVLETANIGEKIRVATAQCGRAGDVVVSLDDATGTKLDEGRPQPLYLNFLSASNFWRVGCWPERIAVALNPAMVAYLCLRHHVDDDGYGERSGDGGTGVVIFDWVGGRGDWDLVKCIVACNTRLMTRSEATDGIDAR